MKQNKTSPTSKTPLNKPLEDDSINTQNIGKKGVTSNLERNYKIDWIPAGFMTFVHLVALAGFFTFSWKALGVALILHWITGGLGITLGYHRLLTHRSFKTPKWVEYFLTLCGSLACQSGPIQWVTAHRVHHAYSDQAQDPHSPLKSFFWSHMGWTLVKNKDIDRDESFKRFSPDLYYDKGHQFFEKTHILWTFLLGGVLYALGGWSFVIWGIFVRLVLVYHCTWFVNSASHVWGYQTYDAKDESRNLWWVALITYGEGWHNNHHAFQTSARHGLKWWEIDTTWWMVNVLKFFGLATDIKLPSEHQLATKAAA